MSKKISVFEKRQSRVRNTLQLRATSHYRLSVYRSNTSIYAQVIDMTSGKVLVSASSRDSELASSVRNGNVDAAKHVGLLVAKRALAEKVNQVYFDRGGYQYHGRVKSLADGAREGGLSF